MALRLELDCQISGKAVKYYVNYGQNLRYQVKAASAAWISMKLIILTAIIC
jgi:hypothetical protein